MPHHTTPLLITSNINWKPYCIIPAEVYMASNIINQWIIKLIYKPSTVLEAITLIINIISVCISLPEIICSWYSVDGSPVPMLPIKYPLSHENKNNRLLFENA